MLRSILYSLCDMAEHGLEGPHGGSSQKARGAALSFTRSFVHPRAAKLVHPFVNAATKLRSPPVIAEPPMSPKTPDITFNSAQSFLKKRKYQKIELQAGSEGAREKM